MAIDFAELVMNMAQAKTEETRNAAAAVEGAAEVRQALTKLARQVESILEGGSDEGGYEVAFVIELALKVEEADRRYESLAGTAADSHRHAKLLEKLVEQAKD